jgi:phosphatidylserine/phosphatidylglycerophosphate/cardiolipin synthase-like enzyme
MTEYLRKRGHAEFAAATLVIAVWLCVGVAFVRHKQIIAADDDSKIQVWFSPKGGCTDAIVKGIDDAKRTIHLMAYEFTSDPIRDALCRACKRGVATTLVVDHKAHSSRHEDADAVRAAGGIISVDAKHNIMHDKIVIVDQRIVFTGSFNHSANAELHNSENLIRIDDQSLAKKYIEHFRIHADHSDKSH